MNPIFAAEPSEFPATSGFTLLELLVVSGVLAVLFGLGIGFLGRTDPYEVAASILAGETRAAQLTARTEGVPTEVLVTPGREGESATVRSRVARPVVAFHLEPNEPALHDTLRPTLGGRSVEQGRFGAARTNDGDPAPLLRWAAPPSVVDLREGFVVRLDLRLQRRGSCTVVRFGQALELTVDDEGRPRARFRLRGGAGAAMPVATVAGRTALPVQQWATLEAGCDGRDAWLSLDGRELDRAVAEGSPLQDNEDLFDVSPSDATLPGIVDEIRVLAYALGDLQYLPNELQPERAYRLTFDARGEPLARPEVKLLLPEERP